MQLGRPLPANALHDSPARRCVWRAILTTGLRTPLRLRRAGSSASQRRSSSRSSSRRRRRRRRCVAHKRACGRPTLLLRAPVLLHAPGIPPPFSSAAWDPADASRSHALAGSQAAAASAGDVPADAPEVERERAANIKRNQAKLAELGLLGRIGGGIDGVGGAAGGSGPAPKTPGADAEGGDGGPRLHRAMQQPGYSLSGSDSDMVSSGWLLARGRPSLPPPSATLSACAPALRSEAWRQLMHNLPGLSPLLCPIPCRQTHRRRWTARTISSRSSSSRAMRSSSSGPRQRVLVAAAAAVAAARARRQCSSSRDARCCKVRVCRAGWRVRLCSLCLVPRRLSATAFWAQRHISALPPEK